MATLKKELKAILDKYGIDPTDKSKLWDCHGTLVLYHKAYEIIAATEKITFDPPQIVEANSEKKTATIIVTGTMGDRKEWSFGEAAPGNCTNKYPFAMAEKRAKDRVIAKLVGLAQYVYSEDEAEEFKEDKKGIYIEKGADDVTPAQFLAGCIKEIERYKQGPRSTVDGLKIKYAGLKKDAIYPRLTEDQQLEFYGAVSLAERAIKERLKEKTA